MNEYICPAHKVSLQVQMQITCNCFWSFSSLIFKHMATVKAGLGGSVAMDIQKFGGVGEDCLSRMWRRLVPVSRSAVAQLSCFQNAIMTLQVCQFLLYVQVLIE